VTTIVLLPGMDGTGILFESFVAELKASAVIVVYPMDQPLGYAELEQLVLASLPRDEPYILLGESFSGPLAISIAARRPPNLQAVVLVCSFAKLPLPGIPAWLQKLVGRSPAARMPVAFTARLVLGPYYTRSLYTVLKQVHDMVAPVVWKARLLAVMSVDHSELLPRVQVPVLCLRAIYDMVVSSSASALISRRAPSVEVVAIEGPHFLLQSRPVECAAAIKAFLGKLGIALTEARSAHDDQRHHSATAHH
jgi:pimeloyl-[acyl-carrier protein] methyl ester esterase